MKTMIRSFASALVAVMTLGLVQTAQAYTITTVVDPQDACVVNCQSDPYVVTFTLSEFAEGASVDTIFVERSDKGERIYPQYLESEDLYFFAMPPCDVVLHVQCTQLGPEPEPGTGHSITIPKFEHGTVTAPDTAETGALVTLMVTPGWSYQLESLSVTYVDQASGSTVSVPVTNNTFTMPDANVTVNATFAGPAYPSIISPSGTEHGRVTSSHSEAACGTTVTLTVEPNEGYVLDSLTVEGSSTKAKYAPTKTGDNTYVFAMPNEPVSATVKFKAVVKYLAPVYNTAGEPTSGIDHWETNSVSDYTVVTSATSAVTWGEAGQTNWYVVASDVTISSRIECVGDVRLILADGATLTASAGITASPNTSGYLGFTVYAQSEGAKMGALVATGANDDAGIGGIDYRDGAYITINGGKVTATGAYDDAGIGGAYNGRGYNIQINGGRVTATGAGGAPGIGGGSRGSSSDIYVQDTLRVLADDSTPPTAAVSHTSATDLSDVSGFKKKYVVTKPKGVEYGITIDATMQHGTVTALAVAESGDVVLLTAVPDVGYTLDTITVTNALGEVVEATRVAARKYTFEMPASAVFVSATFVDATMPIDVSTYQELLRALDGRFERINLTADIVAEDTLQCDYPLTINGNGYVLSVPVTGADEMGVLNADASQFSLLKNTGDLTITDLTLRGGGHSCIVNEQDGVLKVIRCTIERSGGSSIGGGGLFNMGKCYLCDTKLSRNNAEYGGGFANRWGSFMVMERCSVNENRSLISGHGGGAGEVDSSSYLIVNNCTFANNTSTEIGGAINIYSGNVYAINSTFVGNISAAEYIGSCAGGAIGINGGKFYAANTILVNDYAGYGSSISDYPDCDIGLYGSSYVAGAYGCGYGTVRNSGGEVEPETMSTSKHISTNGVFAAYILSPVLNPDGTRGTVLYNRPCIALCENGTYVAPMLPDSSALTGGTPTYLRVPDDVSTFSCDTIMAGYGETPTKLGDLALADEADRVTTYQDGTERVPGVMGSFKATDKTFATLTVEKSEHGTVKGDGSIYGDVYIAGTTVQVEAIPDSGYCFKGWCVNGESTPSVREARYSFKIMENVILRAVFEEGVKYLEPVYKTAGEPKSGIDHWVTNSVSEYTTVTSDLRTWGTAGQTNWYVVANDITINGGVTCKGHVNLILVDGAKLTVNAEWSDAGIATDASGSFTVYGQSNGTGALEATGGDAGGAGIGGNYEGAGSNITLNGGTVTAIGMTGGAGIGGGWYGEGSNITINGGTILVCGVGGCDEGEEDCGYPYGIGNGAWWAGSASGIVIDLSAKVFFNLTGVWEYNWITGGQWREPMAPMPTSFDGMTILTPETPVARTLVGGIENWPKAARTFNLTNAATSATGTIKVNGDPVAFANKILTLTHADSTLKLAVEDGIQVGDTVWAILDKTGKSCRIVGSGDMWNAEQWPGGTNPLAAYQRTIKDLTVKDGVTGIGSEAFYKFYGLTNATFAASVTNVGDYAFLRCFSLERMAFAGSDVTFGEDSFVLMTGIYMKNGMPETYPIPQVTIEGYTQKLYGTNELKGEQTDWTEITTEQQKTQFHFFRIKLEK